MHPFSVHSRLASSTIRWGGGSLAWEPVPAILAALDRAFYAAVGAVVPTGKRWVLGTSPDR